MISQVIKWITGNQRQKNQVEIESPSLQHWANEMPLLGEKLRDSIAKARPRRTGECVCHRCIKEKGITNEWGAPLDRSVMILCPKCGNKRCPHASDHDLECTGSNEPGQKGSIYE